MTPVATRPAVATPHRLMTAEEFAERYTDVPDVELERGRVIRVPPAGPDHSRTTTNASYLLESWARHRKIGRVFTGEAGIITSRGPDSVRGMDCAYYSYARLAKGRLPRSFFETPPPLVVEVYGKGRTWRKLLSKAGEYLRMGVDRVWRLDSRDRSLTVCRSGAEPVKFVATDVIRDRQILPGFAHKVAEFFED